MITAQDWSGSNYDANSTLQYALDCEILKRLKVHGDEHVLDAGCGNGAISALIAKDKVPHGVVHGTDMDSKMIEFARTKYSPLYQNLSFEVQSVDDLSATGLYDVVTSFCMLHWVKDLKVAFSNINRALKDEGKMLIVFPVSYNSPWHDILFSVCRDTKWWSYFHTRSDMQEVSQDLIVNETYLHSICQASHFTPQEIEIHLFTYTFPSVIGYENWFKALSYINSVPAEAQDEFLREHVQKVVEYGRSVLHDTDECVSVQIMYAVVDAVKSAI